MISDRIKRGRPVRAEDITDIPYHTLRGVSPGQNMIKEQCGDKVLLRARGGGGFGGLSIDPVATLPPVPTSGWRFVYWYGDDNEEGGEGDYQVWFAYHGQIMWTPMQYATNKSGIPVAPSEET